MSWLYKILIQLEVYLWMYIKAYLLTQGLSWVPLCLTSWENQKKSAKTSENNCRPPQVWFIPGSNFQTSEGTTFICTNTSTVTTSTEVVSPPCSGGVWRQHHWSSSHRRSTFHFPFVLSCFPTHLVSISLIKHCVFNPLYPPCPCVELFVCKCLCIMLLELVGFCTHVGFFYCRWFWN
jgi:hypothetical protein